MVISESLVVTAFPCLFSCCFGDMGGYEIPLGGNAEAPACNSEFLPCSSGDWLLLPAAAAAKLGIDCTGRTPVSTLPPADTLTVSRSVLRCPWSGFTVSIDADGGWPLLSILLKNGLCANAYNYYLLQTLSSHLCSTFINRYLANYIM